MTAPVTQTSGATLDSKMSPREVGPHWVVHFMMPSGSTLQSLPVANDSSIQFTQTPKRRVAAIQFSGFGSDSNLSLHEAELQRWMESQHLKATSSPRFAYYDPPWTPWFMRTNEVLVGVDSAGD